MRRKQPLVVHPDGAMLLIQQVIYQAICDLEKRIGYCKTKKEFREQYRWHRNNTEKTFIWISDKNVNCIYLYAQIFDYDPMQVRKKILVLAERKTQYLDKVIKERDI